MFAPIFPKPMKPICIASFEETRRASPAAKQLTHLRRAYLPRLMHDAASDGFLAPSAIDIADFCPGSLSGASDVLTTPPAALLSAPAVRRLIRLHPHALDELVKRVGDEGIECEFQ